MKRENIKHAVNLVQNIDKLESFIKLSDMVNMHDRGDVATIVGLDKLKELAENKLNELKKELEEL